MQEKKFCHFCASPLIEKFHEGRLRKFCPGCEQPLYENPVPAACVVLIDENDKILLTKRSVEPQIGYWCLPGGFIELGEAPEDAALRELMEETGVTGQIERLMGVMSDPNALYHTVLITGYLIKQYSGVPVANDDVSDVAFFSVDQLPEIAFESHTLFIRNYYSAYSSDCMENF